MAQPASHIARTRAAVGRLTDAFEEAVACLGEFEWLESTPGTVAAHWSDGEGNPRTDLDLTHEQYVATILAVASLREHINANGLGAPLYAAK